MADLAGHGCFAAYSQNRLVVVFDESHGEAVKVEKEEILFALQASLEVEVIHLEHHNHQHYQKACGNEK